jgi:hypothetical protein
MEITFPFLVIEKDSGDILRFESIVEMQHYLERIDVENNEYAAWDANGNPLRLVVQEPTWLKVVSGADNQDTPGLGDSLRSFARVRKVKLTAGELGLEPMALYEVIVAKGGGGRTLSGVFRSRK